MLWRPWNPEPWVITELPTRSVIELSRTPKNTTQQKRRPPPDDQIRRFGALFSSWWDVRNQAPSDPDDEDNIIILWLSFALLRGEPDILTNILGHWFFFPLHDYFTKKFTATHPSIESRFILATTTKKRPTCAALSELMMPMLTGWGYRTQWRNPNHAAHDDAKKNPKQLRLVQPEESHHLDDVECNDDG